MTLLPPCLYHATHNRLARTAGRLAPLLLLLASLAVPAPAAEPATKSIPASTTRADAKQPWQFSQLGIDAWHTAGYRGKGVKVAVLDSGFRGWRDQLGKALPEHVTARSFRRDGNLEAKDSQHGI